MRLYAATIPAEALQVRSRAAFYARQRRLFALAFALVAIVPLLVLSTNASRFYLDSWMEKTSLELAGLTQDRRELVDLFLRTQEAQLASLVELHHPAELTEARVEALFRALQRHGVITDLGVIDRQGRHLAYAGPFQHELAGRNYAEAEWFVEVMRTGRYVSDVFTGYRKVPHLVVAVADLRKAWLLRATISSELFNGLVASANVGPGGDAFIVNRQGQLQTPSRHGHTQLSPDELARLGALADSGRSSDARGGALFSAARLNGGSWLLVLEANLEASLASYRRARQRDGFLTAGAAALIVLVAVLVTRSMVNRLAEADRQRVVLTDRVRQVEKMALVGRLAASVAHEINNPLQIISEHAGLMDELLGEEASRRVPHRDEHQRSLQKVREQVTRASAITHRLLGFSRAPEKAWALTDVHQLLEDTIGLLEGEARRHRIQLARRYQAAPAEVLTDASQLQQVVLNVLSNAMDAVGSAGEIVVSTRTDGDWLCIDLADSGPGLPAEALEHIFEPFFTTKQSGKGTGLGLFVSRTIAERLGGDLTANNRAEGGASFTVRLPLRRNTPS
jgi:two-component system NtrC family sensor kinase